VTGQGTVERLLSLFATRLNLQISSPEANLLEGGLLDSLLLVELLLALEQEMGVTLSLRDIDLDTFSSVHRLAAYLDGRLGGSRGEP